VTDRPSWLDDTVLAALRSIADRANRHGEICPRCLTRRINRSRTRHGFCARCDADVDEQYRESKRRWWNEGRGDLAGDDDAPRDDQ